MSMVKQILCLLLCVAFSATLAEMGLVVKDQDEEAFNEFVLDYDPSSIAFSNECRSAASPQGFIERWRIVTDLNGDGVDDLILSDDPRLFGNAGGPWNVYIRSNEFWRCIGAVDLYPGMIAFDKVWDEVDLWYYWHTSGREGEIGYYTFALNKMKRGIKAISIRSGHENGENVFRCICKAVFGRPHRHPYRLEASETSTNGVVSWKTVEDWRKPGLKNELYELEQKLSETKKRANAAEARVQQMSRKLHEYEFGVHRLCGVTLGSAWDGGETNRPCEEVFSGFTNMTVSVDGNNFVKAIRLTRKDACIGAAARSIHGGYEPTAEEQKIIHQVENLFNVRFRPCDGKGTYSWGGPMVGTRIYIHFASPKETQSYVEIRYSRRFDE